MAGPESRTIKSAHRVLEMLEYFQEQPEATVMGMSRALEYPQSSTSELLRCLTRLGSLHYNRSRRTYSPTARVALLGAWVEPSFFRRGPVLSAIDAISEATGQTVALSTATNYAVQHIHVVHGSSDQAVAAHIGDTLPLLHCGAGRLLLSSYKDEHIKSAVHRLNAEESDPARRVPLGQTTKELAEMRETGWVTQDNGDGTGSVTVLVRARRGRDRLVISILAFGHVIEARSDEFVKKICEYRDEVNAGACASLQRPETTQSNINPFAAAPRHNSQLPIYA